MSEPVSILESLGKARRFADPSSPLKARMLAAGGALPIPPAQVASVLVALLEDADEPVRDKARQSLEALPDPVVDQVVSSESHPAVLDWFARQFREDEARLEKLALNAAASDETFCFVAGLAFPKILDIVAQNQVRLLRCDTLVDVLGNNSLTSQATLDRILHFLGVERGETEEAPPESETLESPTPPPPKDAEAEPAFDPDDPSELPPELIEEPDPDSKEGEEAQEDQKANLLAQIQEMSVVEKIRLARFGNGEARSILVRDRNRLVATSAIRSPKIAEQEVVTFAKSRNLCDDVYRIIASTRSWVKNYQVKLALAMNAKVPPSTAIKFLNYLTDRDLRTIMRSRDVPGPISQAARRLLMKKGKL